MFNGYDIWHNGRLIFFVHMKFVRCSMFDERIIIFILHSSNNNRRHKYRIWDVSNIHAPGPIPHKIQSKTNFSLDKCLSHYYFNIPLVINVINIEPVLIISNITIDNNDSAIVENLYYRPPRTLYARPKN